MHSRLIALRNVREKTQTKAVAEKASPLWRLEGYCALESQYGPTSACSGRRSAPSEIVAILKPGISSIAISIYRCAAAEAQDVGPEASSRSPSSESVLAFASSRRKRKAFECDLIQRLRKFSRSTTSLGQTQSNVTPSNALQSNLANSAYSLNAFEGNRERGKRS